MLNTNCNFKIRSWLIKKKIICKEINITETFTKIIVFYNSDLENTERIILKTYNEKTKEYIKNIKNLGLTVSLGNINSGIIISFIIENTPDEIFSILRVQGEL